MAGMDMEMELTSGASGRLIPVFRNVREAVLSLRALRKLIMFVQAMFMWIVLRFQYRSIRVLSSASEEGSCRMVQSKNKAKMRRVSREEEDVLARRALAQGFGSKCPSDLANVCWQTLLFVNPRRKVLFTRAWTPVSQNLKGLVRVSSLHRVPHMEFDPTRGDVFIIASNFKPF